MKSIFRFIANVSLVFGITYGSVSGVVNKVRDEEKSATRVYLEELSQGNPHPNMLSYIQNYPEVVENLEIYEAVFLKSSPGVGANSYMNHFGFEIAETYNGTQNPADDAYRVHLVKETNPLQREHNEAEGYFNREPVYQKSWIEPTELGIKIQNNVEVLNVGLNETFESLSIY